MKSILRSATALALALVVSLGASACADPDPDPEPATAPEPAGTADIADAEAAVAAGYEGFFTDLPTDAPPPTETGKVWIISAFQQVSGLARVTEEARTAAEALGWEVSVCDGQNNLNGGWATCVRQAVADNADAIVLNSIDCAPVQQALVEARDAGVVIVGLGGLDCSDPKQGGGQSLFDATTIYADGIEDQADYQFQMGVLRAQTVIAATDGQARILHVQFRGVAFGEYLSEGFAEGVQECAGCETVSTVTITPNEVQQIRQKFEAALVQASDINAVVVDVDFMFAAGIQQALVAADRPDLFVMGGDCAVESVDYIRRGGGQQACIGVPVGYLAWAAIDSLHRVVHGEEPVSSGAGWQLVDQDRNLPAEGEPFEGPVDYRQAYRSAWRVG